MSPTPAATRARSGSWVGPFDVRSWAVRSVAAYGISDEIVFEQYQWRYLEGVWRTYSNDDLTFSRHNFTHDHRFDQWPIIIRDLDTDGLYGVERKERRELGASSPSSSAHARRRAPRLDAPARQVWQRRSPTRGWSGLMNKADRRRWEGDGDDGPAGQLR